MTEELFSKVSETPFPAVFVFGQRISWDDLIEIGIRMVCLRCIILVLLISAAPPRPLGCVSKSISLYTSALFGFPLPVSPPTTPDNDDENECTTKCHQQNLPPFESPTLNDGGGFIDPRYSWQGRYTTRLGGYCNEF